MTRSEAGIVMNALAREEQSVRRAARRKRKPLRPSIAAITLATIGEVHSRLSAACAAHDEQQS